MDRYSLVNMQRIMETPGKDFIKENLKIISATITVIRVDLKMKFLKEINQKCFGKFRIYLNL